jgi:hypothetical protein
VPFMAFQELKVEKKKVNILCYVHCLHSAFCFRDKEPLLHEAKLYAANLAEVISVRLP